MGKTSEAVVRTTTPGGNGPVGSIQTDPVVRATGVVGLGAVAVVHLSQVTPTTKQAPLLGVGFILLTIAATGLAGRLLRRDGRLLWAMVGVLNLLVIGAYAFTRLVSSPLDHGDVGNWSEPAGVAALFIEGALVALSLHVLSGRPAPVASPRGGSARQPGPVVDLRETERPTAEPSSVH